MPVSPGSEGRFGRFDLRGLLGRGGAGDVHLAYDPHRNSLVALKLIRIGLDPEMLEAEQRGVALQQRLQPRVPQVAAVFEFGEAEGFFFVAMEYIVGTDLEEILRNGPFPPVKAVDIAIQLCRILESMERVSKDLEDKGHWVIHSDIKPANIRLQGGERVRLLDFGVAKSVTLSKKFTRNVFGSSPYLAPERLSREVVDSHTDLWAVSVVLYEMLAGYFPFQGETNEAIERRIRSGQPPAPLPVDCPAALKSVLFKCLRTEPTLRFPDAATLRRHLEAFQEGRPLAISEPTQKVTLRRSQPTSRRSPLGLQEESAEEEEVPRSKKPGRVVQVPGERPQPSSVTSPSTSRSKTGFAILGLLLLTLSLSQLYVWVSARQLHRSLLAATVSETESLWQRYRWLDRLGLFDLGATRSEMAKALKRAAEPLLSTPSGDDSRTSVEAWENARKYYSALVEMDSTDLRSQARLAFVRGHLALASADRFEEQGDGEAELRSESEALIEFQRAAELDGRWASPLLSAARIYAYRAFDFVKLQAALESAKKRNAEPRLVSALLADGHVAEGRRLYKQALRVRGSNQEAELLFNVIRNLDQAIDLYEPILGYAQAARNRDEAERSREAASARLAALGYWE